MVVLFAYKRRRSSEVYVNLVETTVLFLNCQFVMHLPDGQIIHLVVQNIGDTNIPTLAQPLTQTQIRLIDHETNKLGTNHILQQ